MTHFDVHTVTIAVTTQLTVSGDLAFTDMLSFSLDATSRYFTVVANTYGDVDIETIGSVRRNIALTPSSIYAMFEGGPVQMKDANEDAGCFASKVIHSS